MAYTTNRAFCLRAASVLAVLAAMGAGFCIRPVRADDARQTTLKLPDAALGTAIGKWALLVGINHYDQPEKVTSLNYARNDARLLFEALIDPAVGAFPRENVFLMTDEMKSDDRPTNDNVAARLWALGRKVSPGDTFVFYFSGHGLVQNGASCPC